MKFVYALLALSLGIILFGIYLISQTPPAPVANEPPPREIGLVPVPAPIRDSDVPDVDSEPGSEPWCEMMMHKASESWADDEARTFADHCIYQN